MFFIDICFAFLLFFKKVNILDCDLDEGGDWGVDFLKLKHSFLGYALGQKGSKLQFYLTKRMFDSRGDFLDKILPHKTF